MTLTPIEFDVILDEEIVDGTEEVVAEIAPSRTWKLDFESGRIGGFIDDDEAVRQFIRKALATPRNRYLIYDDDYGEELTTLIGDNITPELLTTEIPRLLREAVIYDDRIDSLLNINVDIYRNDGVHISAQAQTVAGDIIDVEVTL